MPRAKPKADAVLILAPRSIDERRLIRRSLRCLLFGALGAIPILGMGLAWQATQIRRSVYEEMGLSPPSLLGPWYWVAGLALIGAADAWLGWAGAAVLCVLLVVGQSWLIGRNRPMDPGPVWNPGDRELLWGAILAYGGLAISLWACVLVFYHVVRTSTPL